MYHFPDDRPAFSDVLISDFSDLLFQTAFKTYFSELGINVKDWDGLFREMNDEGDIKPLSGRSETEASSGLYSLSPQSLRAGFLKKLAALSGNSGYQMQIAMPVMAQHFCDLQKAISSNMECTQAF